MSVLDFLWVPAVVLMAICILVFSRAGGSVAARVEKYQTFITGTAAVVLASLTVNAVVTSTDIQKSEIQRIEKLGAMLLAVGLENVESQFCTATLGFIDEATQIKIPNVLINFDVLATQKAETAGKVTRIVAWLPYMEWDPKLGGSKSNISQPAWVPSFTDLYSETIFKEIQEAQAELLKISGSDIIRAGPMLTLCSSKS